MMGHQLVDLGNSKQRCVESWGTRVVSGERGLRPDNHGGGNSEFVQSYCCEY